MPSPFSVIKKLCHTLPSLPPQTLYGEDSMLSNWCFLDMKRRVNLKWWYKQKPEDLEKERWLWGPSLLERVPQVCVHTCAPSAEHAGRSLLHLTQSLLPCCVSSHLWRRVNQLLLNTRTANPEQAWSGEDGQQESAWVRSVGSHGPDRSEGPKAALPPLCPSTFLISRPARCGVCPFNGPPCLTRCRFVPVFISRLLGAPNRAFALIGASHPPLEQLLSTFLNSWHTWSNDYNSAACHKYIFVNLTLKV